jgi:hypothetical protein
VIATRVILAAEAVAAVTLRCERKQASKGDGRFATRILRDRLDPVGGPTLNPYRRGLPTASWPDLIRPSTSCSAL